MQPVSSFSLSLPLVKQLKVTAIRGMEEKNLSMYFDREIEGNNFRKLFFPCF